MGKVVILVGLVIAGLGALMSLGVPLGNLPGDLVYRRGNMTLYIPISTSIILSVVVTAVMMLLRR